MLLNITKIQRLLFDDADKKAAIAGIVLSILLIALFLKKGSSNVYLIIPVLTMASCLIWLIIGRSQLSIDIVFNHFNNKLIKATSIIYFILLPLSLLTIYFRPDIYERPLLFFIIIAMMTGIIAIEILYAKRVNYFIFVKIIIIGIILSWSELLIFPGLVGADPWFHQMFTMEIINNYHVPTGPYFFNYSAIPLFHIIIAATSILTNLDYKISAMLSVTVIQIVCNIFFIYFIGSLLFNKKVGLLASLILVISNYEISMSFESIPNSLAAIFIPIILFLIIKSSRQNSDKMLWKLLILVFMIAAILTHTITSACISIVLIVVWIGYKGYKLINPVKNEDPTPINITFILFFIISMFIMFQISGLLSYVSDWTFGGPGSEITTAPINDVVNKSQTFEGFTFIIAPLYESIINNLGMFLLFAISFIGIFYSYRKNNYSFVIAFVGLIPLAMSFSSIIINHSIIEQRWWYFSEILLSIPCAISLVLLFNKTGKKVYTIFVFFIIFTFLMIISSPANIDNQTFTPILATKYALNETDIVAANFAVGHSLVGHSQIINIDRIYDYYFWSNESIQSSIQDKIIEYDLGEQMKNLTLIRNEIIDKPIPFQTSQVKIQLNLTQIIGNNSDTDLVYANGDVNTYNNAEWIYNS